LGYCVPSEGGFLFMVKVSFLRDRIPRYSFSLSKKCKNITCKNLIEKN
jgi:hypothetical protein